MVLINNVYKLNINRSMLIASVFLVPTDEVRRFLIETSSKNFYERDYVVHS